MPGNMPVPASRRFLTPRECADELRVSTATIYRLIDSGRVPVVRIGAQWRINFGALLEADARSRPSPYQWMRDLENARDDHRRMR